MTWLCWWCYNMIFLRLPSLNLLRRSLHIQKGFVDLPLVICIVLLSLMWKCVLLRDPFRAVFQMTVEKPKPKQLLRPITTGSGSAMNQSQFPAITCNSLEARENSLVHGAIGFGFAFHWLKNWRESFKPISKRSNRNHVITFASHLKTALETQ